MEQCNELERESPPSDYWARHVCKIGQGAATCRYLTVGADGWHCAKADLRLMAQIDARDNMTAKADNCTGRA
jgi:hypothetical protein